MTKKNDGGPAFPMSSGPGMSLRDWFAGQFLAAIDDKAMARYVAYAEAEDDRPERCIARAAYSIADAMLEKRDK